jgi:hypothetical protein
VWSISEARTARGQRQGEEIRPVVNVIVRELAALERYLSGGVDDAGAAESARVHHLPGSRDVPPGAGRSSIGGPSPSAAADAEEHVRGAEVGSSMRAAVPPMQSFGGGRRR